MEAKANVLVVGLYVLFEIFVRHSSKLRVLNLDSVELFVVPRCDLLFKSFNQLSLDMNPTFLLAILPPRSLLGFMEPFGFRIVSLMSSTRVLPILSKSTCLCF